MNTNGVKVHCGRCLCGSVQYTVEGEPIIVAHCHCEDCQRWSGAGHSTAAMFSNDKFQMTGLVETFKLQSHNGKEVTEVTRVFCPSCGSSIYGCNTGSKGFLAICLGTFDDSSEFVPSVTIFSCDRKPWDMMDVSIETFETQPYFNPGKL